MPTTRRQSAQQREPAPQLPKAVARARNTSIKSAANVHVKDQPVAIGEKHVQEQSKVEVKGHDEEGPPAKRPKTQDGHSPHIVAGGNQDVKEVSDSIQKTDGKEEHPAKHAYQTGGFARTAYALCSLTVTAGTIERGHIYFFYRPKVELEEAHSVDEVQRFCTSRQVSYFRADVTIPFDELILRVFRRGGFLR